MKVLVRYNPESDEADEPPPGRAPQAAVGDYVHAHDRRLMFELLVPMTHEQSDRLEGDCAPLRSRSAAVADDSGDQGATGRGRGARRLEDRGSGSARGLRGGRQGREARRPRQGRLHHPGPRLQRRARFLHGSAPRPRCPALSVSRSAGRRSGTHWSRSAMARCRASRPSVRSPIGIWNGSGSSTRRGRDETA